MRFAKGHCQQKTFVHTIAISAGLFSLLSCKFQERNGGTGEGVQQAASGQLPCPNFTEVSVNPQNGWSQQLQRDPQSIMRPANVTAAPAQYTVPMPLRGQLHEGRNRTSGNGGAENCGTIFRLPGSSENGRSSGLRVDRRVDGNTRSCGVTYNPPSNAEEYAGFYHTHPGKLSFAPDDVAACLQHFALMGGPLCFLVTQDKQYLLVSTEATKNTRLYPGSQTTLANFPRDTDGVRNFLERVRNDWDSAFADYAGRCRGDSVAATERAAAFLAAKYNMAFYRAGGNFQYRRLEHGWTYPPGQSPY